MSFTLTQELTFLQKKKILQMAQYWWLSLLRRYRIPYSPSIFPILRSPKF